MCPLFQKLNWRVECPGPVFTDPRAGVWLPAWSVSAPTWLPGNLSISVFWALAQSQRDRRGRVPRRHTLWRTVGVWNEQNAHLLSPQELGHLRQGWVCSSHASNR